MIVSVSRRTDIPCRHSEWFMNRIRAGYVVVRNPMNHGQINRIPLSPETVDGIVFWSKDPAPLMPYLKELSDRGYRYYFQFTLTPYGKNLEPGLRDKKEIEESLANVYKRFPRLEERKNQMAGTLSGGEQQMLAMGRALMSKPKIILMDEPFGAVDEITRRRLQEEILRIHEELGGTIVFVTHDIKEALKLGSRVLVMDHGNIIQDGSPTELLEHPATDFVRRLVAG